MKANTEALLREGRPVSRPAAPKVDGTVVDLLFAAAAARPDAPALVCEGETLSYSQYAADVRALAAELKAELSADAAATAGSETQQRVAVIMRNGIDACVAHFGVLASGAQLLPMNPDYTARELAYQLDDAECRLLVADPALRESIEPLGAAAGRRVIWMGPGRRRAASPAAPGQTAAPAKPDPASLAILQYTGGTSGRPKGVNLSHASLRANVEQREAVLPTRDTGERILCTMPLFHSYGMAMGLYLAARCGGCLLILPGFRRDEVFDAIEHQQITIFPGSPSIYVALMAHPRFARTDWSKLRICYSGASALPAAVLRQWEATVGVPVFEGYGQTEAGPVLSFNGPLWPVKPGSVGRALPETEIQIVDVEQGDVVLAAGHCGEIRARGPQIMEGYRKLPAESAAALRDGWLYTGDIGEFDDEGYLFIRGRKKEMVIVGGYNVYPREVEEVLAEHPAVLEAAVIGQPDAYRGECLHAFVVAREGLTLSDAELESHCAANLAGYKRPARISLLQALPRTAINKIDKEALKRLTGEAPADLRD